MALPVHQIMAQLQEGVLDDNDVKGAELRRRCTRSRRAQNILQPFRHN